MTSVSKSLYHNYRGEFATDVLANANKPVEAGDLYYNTTYNRFKYFNGTVWLFLMPGEDKIVTVDPFGTPGVNCDFTTIALAVAYLKSFPGVDGGEIYLVPGVHQISTVVDAAGVTIRSGEFYSVATIQAVTGGVLRISGGTVQGVTVDVPAGFGGTYFIEVTANLTNVQFLGVDFRPASGKYIFGTTVGPWVATLLFQLCGQSLQTGRMIDPAGVYALLNSVVLGTSQIGPLQFGTRDVYADQEGRFDTTGTIIPIPLGTITTAPGENIQSRINGLATGGIGGEVMILPGTHNITKALIVCCNNVNLQGFGTNTILNAPAATWRQSAFLSVVNYLNLLGDNLTITTSVGGPTVLTEGVNWTAAVSNLATANSLAAAINAVPALGVTAVVYNGGAIVVTANIAGTTISGLTPSDAVNLRAELPANRDSVVVVGDGTGIYTVSGAMVQALEVRVEAQIHGISIFGGDSSTVQGCAVVAYATISSRVGILFTNGYLAVGRRFKCINNAVQGLTTTFQFTDGIHFDGGVPGGFTGIFGFNTNTGIRDSLCGGNHAEANVVVGVFETVYLFTYCTTCSMVVNRSRDCPRVANGIVLGFLGCDSCQLIDMTIVNNLSGGAPDCVYIWATTRCLFDALYIDGITTNFIRGMYIFAGSTLNIVGAGNYIRRCTTAIRLENGSNTIHQYKYETVTNVIQDTTTTNTFVTQIQYGSGNPNGVVTSLFGERFFDSGSSTIYLCTSYPVGTVWQVI